MTFEETIRAGLERGPVLLIVDTRKPGVEVPAEFRNEVNLKLRISPRFALQDLLIGPDGICQTLSFAGTSFVVVLPWDSLLGCIFEHKGEVTAIHIFHGPHMPVEIQQRFAEALISPCASLAKIAAPVPTAEKSKSFLRLVPSNEEQND